MNGAHLIWKSKHFVFHQIALAIVEGSPISQVHFSFDDSASSFLFASSP